MRALLNGEAPTQKSKAAFKMLCEAVGAVVDDTYHSDHVYTLVWTPGEMCMPSDFPGAKRFILGAGHSLIPRFPLTCMKVMDKRCVFNVYSKTNLSNWEMKGGANLRLIDFALPVDTSFYCSDCLPRRTKRFIYFDNRSEVDLQQIVQGLRSKGLEFEIVSEDISDADYLSLLQSSKYGIWIGGHTMEGFKYREALSCNVPLVVWNIIHLDEQVKYTEDGGLYASSIPWWDARCGLTAYDAQTILLNIQKMEETWESYTPRQYILETASPSACGREWFQGLY